MELKSGQENVGQGRGRAAFTLVEIMVVVVIIGLLSSVAVPAFQKIQNSAKMGRLANDFRIFATAIQTFSLEQGYYPEDSGSGDIPTGFGPYISVAAWNKGPSIGGVWDVEKDDNGVTSAIGVHGQTVEDAFLLRFDEKYDDGDLSSGIFRKIAGDRYYWIVAK